MLTRVLRTVRLDTIDGRSQAGVAMRRVREDPFLRLGKTLEITTSKKARQNRTKKKAMPREELTRFLTKVEEVAPRFSVLFLFLMRTGLRINEALALRVTDIDLARRQVRVEREKVRNKDGRWVLGPPKSDHGIRTVKLSAQLTDVLQPYLDIERAKDKLRHGWRVMPPWLFYAEVDPATYAHPTAGTLDAGNVRRVMRAVLHALHDADRDAGLPAEQCFPLHFTPHSFRHSFASLLLSDGQAVQYTREQMGHDSIDTTADTYGSWLPSTATDANDCLDDPKWREASHHAATDGN